MTLLVQHALKDFTLSKMSTSTAMYINSSTRYNVTGSTDFSMVLWSMNESLVKKRIPAIIFVSFLAAIGSFGNGLVIYAYRSYRHRSTVNVFIFWLSVFDFSLCFFEMPYKAFEIRFPLMYGYPPLCKSFMFVEIFLSMVSVILLLCIAFDRFLVVRRPLQRLTMENIHKIILVCVILGFVFSWPTIFIYGESRTPTQVAGVFGWGCGISTDMMKSKVVPFWYYFLYAMFIVPCIILIVLYVSIWISIRKWKYTTIGESMGNLNMKLSLTTSTSSGARTSSTVLKYKTSFETPPAPQAVVKPRTSVDAGSDSSSPTTSTSATPSGKRDSSEVHTTMSTSQESPGMKRVRHARMRRNTLIFGAIALTFVLSYLPILTIIFLRTAKLYNMQDAPLWQAQLFEICHRSGYINNAANPFIYAFLSPWFRQKVRELFVQ